MLQSTENRKKPETISIIVLVLIVILGLALRVAKTNTLPLDAYEATFALDVEAMLRGNQDFGQALYSVETGLFFWLFEANNFFARLLPVLTGTMIILLPWLMGDLFSNRMKLILSVGLAVDPALVAASKTIGSDIFAVAVLWLALICFLKKKPVATGIVLALFLLSGNGFILGGLIFGIALLWMLIRDTSADDVKRAFVAFDWRKAGVSFIAAYLLISSALFTNPAGLSAIFRDIGILFQMDNLTYVAVGIFPLLISLVFYELFPLILGVWGSFVRREESSFWMRFCLVLILAGLVVVLVNPGRMALHLVWLSVPLWLLASRQIEKIINGFQSFDLISLGVAAFLFLMLGFILFSCVSAVNVDGVNVAQGQEGSEQQLFIRVLLIAGSLVLMGISYFLATYTWNSLVSRQGLVIGAGVFLILFGLLSQSWHSAYLGNDPSAEMWRPAETLFDADRLVETVADISEMNHGLRKGQPIVIAGIDSPALEWALRDHHITKTDVILAGESSEMVITPLPAPQEFYTGQDFVVGKNIDWASFSGFDWLSWMLFHESEKYLEERAILWVRTDMFPGGGAVNE